MHELNVAVEKEPAYVNDLVIRIVYSGDIAYFGQVNSSELVNPKDGITMYNPLVINIRPVTNKNDQEKLEAVVLDIMLPIEFAGIPLNEQLYTGFVNFLPTVLDLPSGKVSYMQMENGERMAVNRIPSIADRSNPSLRLYNVSKIIIPCQDMINIYKIKLASYNELLYGTRMIEFQQTQADANEQKEFPGNENGRNAGNVIDIPRTVH